MSDIQQTLITKAGLEKLKTELEDLKTNGRREVAERLKDAISYGDLSENAEYDEAKNQQAFLEARITELENQIKNVKLIKESSSDKGMVQLGSKVTIKNIETKESHEYYIVGSTESDIMSHKISNESPVGNALLGKKANEIVTAIAPKGEVQYKIMKVA